MKGIQINSKQVVDTIISKISNVGEIFIFGSHSKNINSANSDIDILVKLSKSNDLAFKYPIDIPDYIDLYIWNKNEAKNYKTNFSFIENNTSKLTERLKPIKIWDNKIRTIQFDKVFNISDISQIKLTGGK